ncbi:CPBP family intramembrane glutamic endopeptidase [Paenibacillus sp. XY044]|uniref:CPBP family intramembrane glutamic endopeptidase n=1 Tax=Paenibacillus sp. XY044 TaxID=2026089 RepID=UPI0015C6485E|nr:CPBP family intramembrane glutamic endopeptidase [Paenibacillus sp. XY044]
MTGHVFDYTAPSTLTHPFWLIVIAQFIGAAGEEIGWRCFLQPALQTRMGSFPASMIVGLLWGAWHIGVFAEGWAYAALFMLSAVSISVLLGELLRGLRGGQLLISASVHALINLGMLLWLNEEDGSQLAMGTLAFADTIAAIAAICLLRVRAANRRASGKLTL